MRRLFLIAVGVSCLVYGLIRFNQEPQPTSAPEDGAPLLAASRPDAAPVDPVRYDPFLHQVAPTGKPVRSDSLSEKELLRRISRIYRYQAALLEAQMKENGGRTERLLDKALAELALLLAQPGITEHPRFLELYRTIVMEYERYYGAPPDSLVLQRGDIFAFRDDLFGMLDKIEDPLLEDLSYDDLRPLQTTVPMTMNRLVEQSISYLLRDPNRHLYSWLSRAETYFPMIEQILREEGVPDELKYLALIESGLNPTARSWASAAGMWQFMAPTGRQYGLHADAWVDERLDPEKSTRAAARYLRDLHRQLGDWHLALAAYNCGPGNVRRAIRRSGQRASATFWTIYPHLPRETRNYVPMFIAAALVASNPNAFDLKEVEPGPSYAYDYVPVRGMIALQDLARLSGTSEQAIRALNPELRRGSTPPSRDPYYVRIPLGTHDLFAAQLAARPEQPSAPAHHEVRRGETLNQIARRYGISTALLMRTNGLRRSTIRPGQRLQLPLSEQHRGQPQVSLAHAEPVRVQYGPRALRPLTAVAPVAIAQATVAAPAPPAPEKPASSAPIAQAAAKQEGSSAVVYKVRRGDTLGKIGRRYRVSVRDLQRWNGLHSSRIFAGQRLTIYASAHEAASSRTASTRVLYRVRRGDTLSGIGRKHGVSVSSLKRWNNLRSSRIRAGQRLAIYT